MDVMLEVALEPNVTAPRYESEGAAGMDLRASESVELAPMQRKLVATGVRIAVPPGFEAQVRPRSGLAMRHGVTMVNSPGTIDSDYRGEIKLIMINLGETVVKFERGERVAQLVVCPIARAEVRVVETLDETERGTGGFGSTGT